MLAATRQRRAASGTSCPEAMSTIGKLMVYGKDMQYWSSLAKVLHTWRDQTADVFSAWVRVGSVGDALKCAKL
eukprot:10498000-Alexandrium_andersonii.AAC.1